MKHKRILLIDDEKDLLELLGEFLEASDYEVLKASDGKEGLALARQEKPDLILLDVMMPRMDGYKMCRFLKSQKKCRDIPVILLTARSQVQDRKFGKELGVDAYVTKPFEHGELLKKIKHCLAQNA